MRNRTQELAFRGGESPGATPGAIIDGPAVDPGPADDPSAAEPSARSRRSLDDHIVVVSFVFVGAATSIAFAPQVFNDAVFPWDFLGTASAAPPFVAESIADGRWPTWSNFVGSGQALSIDAQSGLYYPLWWILGVLDVPLSVTFLAKIHVAHVALGGLGLALLARARGVRGLLIPMAGVAFVMFGGFYSQAQHVTHFRGFALFPWLLWCLTFPHTGVATRRLVWLPLVVWMAVAGIYPGQIVSFAVLGYRDESLDEQGILLAATLLLLLGLAASVVVERRPGATS